MSKTDCTEKRGSVQEQKTVSVQTKWSDVHRDAVAALAEAKRRVGKLKIAITTIEGRIKAGESFPA